MPARADPQFWDMTAEVFLDPERLSSPVLRMDRQIIVASPGRRDSNRADEVDERLRVADAGDVRQARRLVCEQRGRDEGKRSVLIAARLDGSRSGGHLQQRN